MDPTPTPYEVLGVSEGAEPQEIRKAYVRLARQMHPDAHAGRSAAERAHAERRMSAINAAWSVLSHAERRAEYDEQRAREPRARTPPAGPSWRPRAEDDGWMDDFESWRHETDVLPPDPPGPRRPVRLLPVAVFALAGVVGCVGLVLGSQPLLAAAASLVLMSASLFVWLPMAELARSRRHDPDR